MDQNNLPHKSWSQPTCLQQNTISTDSLTVDTIILVISAIYHVRVSLKIHKWYPLWHSTFSEYNTLYEETVFQIIEISTGKHVTDLKITIYITIYSGIIIHTQCNWFKNNNSYKIRSALFWDITRRHVVTVYRRFGTTYRSLDPWRWDQYVVPKRRWTITTRRCVIPQNSADLINIAAEARNQSI
jgi:hypothetical protein